MPLMISNLPPIFLDFIEAIFEIANFKIIPEEKFDAIMSNIVGSTKSNIFSKTGNFLTAIGTLIVSLFFVRLFMGRIKR